MSQENPEAGRSIEERVLLDESRVSGATRPVLSLRLG
jgi:hypothetical protein